MDDVKVLGEQVVRSVRDLVRRTFEAAEKRIDAFEGRLRETDARVEQLPAQTRKELLEIAAALPVPKDGRDGRDGKDGEKGIDGQHGRDGIDGKDGKDGEKGIDGQHGRDGIDGKDGKDGEKGIDGQHGRDGIDGKDGQDGINGKDGQDGINGKDGQDGINGKDGQDGINGKDGQDGRHGKDGEDGLPGRDALEITILDSIDVTRAYPRGTFASHDGGVIRAMRRTDPVTGTLEEAGWRAIVEGVRSIDVSLVGDRELTVAVAKTSGGSSVLKKRLPIPVYQDIFSLEKKYEHADMVTCAGSVWMALKDDPAGSPGAPGSDWKLIVKRGRDGKQGDPGKKGDPGAPGSNGRDLTIRDANGGRF